MAHRKVFPLLYVNLSSEMLYIIEQRLQAQNIDAGKSSKVLNDILSTILNRKFLMDIFEPTTLWQHAAVKSLMEKIVHASIMRLGHQSFEKLYDLMVMAFKYQLFAAPGPESLLDITLRHLENLAPMTDDPEISLQVQHLQGLVINHYEKLSPWSWMQMRHLLLNYLHDYRTRVSIFLKKGLQSEAGFFYLDLEQPLPAGVQMPRLAENLPNRQPPYQLQIRCNDQQVQPLGSNLFNEPRKLRRRGGPIPSLDRLFLSAQQPPDEPDRNTPEESEPSTPSDFEALQVLLPPTPTVRDDLIQPENMATLLELFDQAAH